MAIKKGHHFPTKFGFTGSSGKVKVVGGYTRSAPRYAKGGRVPDVPKGAIVSAARQVVREHVNAPAPRGHKGLKG